MYGKGFLKTGQASSAFPVSAQKIAKGPMWLVPTGETGRGVRD